MSRSLWPSKGNAPAVLKGRKGRKKGRIGGRNKGRNEGRKGIKKIEKKKGRKL